VSAAQAETTQCPKEPGTTYERTLSDKQQRVTQSGGGAPLLNEADEPEPCVCCGQTDEGLQCTRCDGKCAVGVVVAASACALTVVGGRRTLAGMTMSYAVVAQ
jgi:hypothetical protein